MIAAPTSLMAKTLVYCSEGSPEGFDAAQLGGFLDPSEQQHPLIGDEMVFAEMRRAGPPAR